MSLATDSNTWDQMEDAALKIWNLQFESLADVNEVIKSIEFLPLLALCLWHTDLVSVPPFTRMFALISLAAACYPSPLRKENFEGALPTYLHDVIGNLFTYACSLDAFFCTLSFVYKGIILEARMGSRRFFNLVFLLAVCVGSLKFFLRQTNFSIQGGMYPLLLSLKVVINYTCLFHHPIRFPVLHPFLTRRLRFFEFFIALVRTRSPQDLVIGVAAGTALIACLNDPNSYIHPLLGEDGTKVVTVSTTKMVFRGRSGGVVRWVKTVSPSLITSLWLTTVVVSYAFDHNDLPSFFGFLSTFDPGHPLTWLIPTHGAVSLTHFIYLLFLVYRTPSTFGAAFKDANVAAICFFAILPLSRTFSLMLLNAAHNCSPLSLWCLDFGKRFSDSCSVLLAANTFAEISAVTPARTGIVLMKLGLEVAMIWKFFPEVHLLSALGAYGAGGLLAVVSMVMDRDRVFLADLPKTTRKADVRLVKNPKRQYGSVTETSSTESSTGAPLSPAKALPNPGARGSTEKGQPSRRSRSPSITLNKPNIKKQNIKMCPSNRTITSSKEDNLAERIPKSDDDKDNVPLESDQLDPVMVENPRDNKSKGKMEKNSVSVTV